MRDERWVNRFLFAWDDTLFYDPLDVYYRPRPDHFLSDLDEETRSRFVRSGIWWSYRHNPALPTQGWKIHVSASRHDVREVVGTVIGYLTEQGVDFKVALDLNVFEMLNSKGMARGSSGKLITIYPNDDDEFRRCLADLARLLADAEGAYVLSDMRYRDCKALYFRYGQLLDTHTVDAMGRRVPYIMGPDGPVPDDRKPAFSQPWWLPWPLDDWKPAEEADDEELLGGRFRVVEAIQFSSSGGVYRAEDTAHGDRPVVIKEARPHTHINLREGHDAVDINAREWTFLNRLADVGSFPAPVARFRHWEHHFLAEEFVEGSDIRAILFEHNPLVKPRFDAAGSRDFLRVFLTVFRGLASAIQAAHERHVILGDLTATNLLIDRDTFKVTVIDLESCRLTESTDEDQHLQQSIELYTPGFSHSRRFGGASSTEGDLYSVAAIMAYFIFPIAAMSFLREDVFDLYRIYTDNLGWPEEIHKLIVDLAEAKTSLSEVLDQLGNEAELVERVELPTRPPVVEQRLGLAEVEAGVGAFIEATADLDRRTLFPVDPFAHLTNPLSLGFGATGVLWALDRSGLSIRAQWRTWLDERVRDIEVDEYPNGLMSGLAGIAWALDDIGAASTARELLAQANRRVTASEDYTFYYGLAGLGMTNLRFYLRGHAEGDLAAARRCAQLLRDSAHRDGEHVYWLNEFATDGPLTGLGFGQAGVALFLLRMYQITRDESYLRLGRRALDWEMANAVAWDGDSVTFEHNRTLLPYVEVGSAGVAQVLLRYGDLAAARPVLRSLDIDYAAMPGYAFGMSGIVDALLDAAEILGDRSYRQVALRQLDYVRKVFLFEPAQRFGVPRRGDTTPLAMPGEGLLRCACDLMTGSAGVLRVLHRVNHGGTTDFLLDEVPR
ncbi:serine/threonine protein kinase [Micromonospora qiuiae]|uniref:Serine/threonine protein kinase n=1 Tax=Micromonospora qiuiae TaxID=502268 RepID=A0ABQ4JGY4_9ACTN|nr:class III lanthionine synthetase LanKC [Micromonospora qiuiae]GIJ29890.1 serine/threonine protein kinase [Micromonospora qiuiae]